MARPRPRRALRPSLVTRAVRITVPALVLVAATSGVVVAWPDSRTQLAVPTPVASSSAATSAPSAPSEKVTSEREARTSRGTAGQRTAAPAADKPTTKPPTAKLGALIDDTPPLKVTGSKYTRVDLNVRSKADADSTLITVLKKGSKLSLTNTVRDGWRYISHKGKGGWVKDRYLVVKKPAAATAAAGGISTAVCKSGSKVESGLTKDAIRVHRAACALFPQVSSFGGVRADSLPAHPSGRALDAMISDSKAGWALANWARANAKKLGVSEVIYSQKIWTVQRGSEGWRSFSDRGSATANHYDHVHITVYGSSGS